ncbi:MAG: hypothetical protein WBE72_05340 [Terracidiphilus sp.]
MKIDVQGWDFGYTSKRLIVIGVAILVAYWFFKPGAPDKPRAPLDYRKPVYTTESTVACPVLALLVTSQWKTALKAIEDHDADAGKSVGCIELPSGTSEHASRFDKDDLPYAYIDNDYFVDAIDLTNDPEGKVQYVDSNTAQPSSSTPTSTTKGETFDPTKTYVNTAPASPIPLSNGTGTVLVSAPSKVPILKGDVKSASLHGFGAVTCPDSKTFAAFVDIPNQNSDQESDPTSKKVTSDIDTFRRYGCSYFPPDTPMFSDGGDPSGSLVSVRVDLHDGRTVTGVTFSNWITQNEQLGQDAAH